MNWKLLWTGVIWLSACRGADTKFDEPLIDDVDGDGFLLGEDCDDENADVNPDMAELCNGLDDNCDGSIDEGLSDVDADGVCDELDSESCDGVDNDGDGEVDEDFEDVDGDGIADCVDGEDCDGIDNNGDGDIDEGYVDTDGDGIADCVDSEECDGLDNDGDGTVDEDLYVEDKHPAAWEKG